MNDSEFEKIVKYNFPMEAKRFESDNQPKQPEADIHDEELISAAINDPGFQSLVRNHIDYTNSDIGIAAFNILCDYCANNLDLSRNQTAIAISRCAQLISIPRASNERQVYSLEQKDG
jgi:hypothetical protein